MREELKLHIKKLERQAALSLIAILSTIISIGFGILFLFIPSFVAIIFFIIATVCIVYLIHSSHAAKKEAKEALRKFDELTGGSLTKEGGASTSKKKGFMDKIKESLDDL